MWKQEFVDAKERFAEAFMIRTDGRVMVYNSS